MAHLPRLMRRSNPEGRMAVLDHLRELRRRLIIVLIIVALGAVIGYAFYDQILGVLTKPYCAVPAKHRFNPAGNGGCTLVYNNVLGGFTARLQISIIAGAILTAPLWLYQIWGFVTPGLRRNERKYTLIFIAASTILFLIGVVLAYAMLWKGIPLIVKMAGDKTTALVTVTAYVNFVTLTLVIFGASFELPLLVVMLNAVRVLPYRFLRKWQRMAIFLIFVFAGVATPTTDPYTMTAMAIAMCLLYEAAVLYCFFHDRRRDRRRAAESHEALPDDQASSVDPIPVRLDETDHSALP